MSQNQIDPPIKPAKTQRDAVIFVPGLAVGITSKSINGVASRICRALDLATNPASAEFRIDWLKATVGTAIIEPNDPVATIYRKGGQDTRAGDEKTIESPVLDLFEYRWSDRVIEGWETQGLIRRSLRTILALCSVPRIVRSFVAAGHTTRGRLQMTLAVAAGLIMVAYTAILLWAVWDTADQLVIKRMTAESSSSTADQPIESEVAPAGVAGPETIATSPTAADESTAARSGTSEGSAEQDRDPESATWRQWVAVGGGLILAFTKKQGDYISQAGGALFATKSYLEVGTSRPGVLGKFEQLCQDIAAQPEKYSRIHIVGYSFGAIIALDALFPKNEAPAPSFGAVDCLVTIGAPIDFVQVVRPDWYAERGPGDIPRRWFNLYDPADLLGSALPESKGPGSSAAPPGIKFGDKLSPRIIPGQNIERSISGVSRPSFQSLVEFYGFRVHGMYWGSDDDTDEKDIFNDVIKAIYLS